MSKEKQIEEMAKALTKYEYSLCERLPKNKCLLTSAIHAQVSCDYCKIAEHLYNAGYRKQSEGEWIKATPYSQEYCNQCGLTPKTIFGKLPPYCPNCGAKMKGGAE